MNEQQKRYSDLDLVFPQAAYLNRSNEDLQKDIQSLCSVMNRNAESRDIIRALTINHIQMARLIQQLNQQNGQLQKWLLLLAILTVAVALAGIFL